MKLDRKPYKFTIAGVKSGIAVEAQYNPREVQIDKSVTWSKHKDAGADEEWLEFTGSEGQTMSFELLFDMYETGGDVSETTDKLFKLTEIQDRNAVAADSEKRAPPIVIVTHGDHGEWIRAVVESLSVKFTMFSASGIPVRAVANLKLKKAAKVSAQDRAAAATPGNQQGTPAPTTPGSGS